MLKVMMSSKDDNVANKDNDGKEVKPSTVTPAPLNDSCAELSYRSYVDVIDLTGEVPLEESVDSDLDELPEVPISMTSRTARSTCMDLPEVFQEKHAMLQHQQRVITGKNEEDMQRIHATLDN